MRSDMAFEKAAPLLWKWIAKELSYVPNIIAKPNLKPSTAPVSILEMEPVLYKLFIIIIVTSLRNQIYSCILSVFV